MKFRSQISLLQLLALAASLLWLCTAIAGGKPIKVESVNPNVAAPSEELTVMISGSGFNDNDIVEFFFTEEDEISENSEISVVGSSKSNGRGTELTVKIKVKDGAQELSYDIVVRSNGRRGKGTDLFSVSKAGGGHVLPTFDVTFDGNLDGSYGLMWQSNSKQSSITYFASDPQGGLGVMNLRYFQLGFGDTGPFNATQGMNCFDEMTSLNAVQFFPDKNGDAILKGSFIGFSIDPTITMRTFMYLFTLTGKFDDSSNWLPQDPLDPTTVTITSWKLKLGSKQENNRYSDITCTGAGTIAATIGVFRNN
jgi:hypothetical protein